MTSLWKFKVELDNLKSLAQEVRDHKRLGKFCWKLTGQQSQKLNWCFLMISRRLGGIYVHSMSILSISFLLFLFDMPPATGCFFLLYLYVKEGCFK